MCLSWILHRTKCSHGSFGNLLLLNQDQLAWLRLSSHTIFVNFEQMMLYLSFPVAMFWISNQAEYFEEYIVKRKREIFPPEEEHQRKELEDFKERMRVRKEQRLLKTLASESQNWGSFVKDLPNFPAPVVNDYAAVCFGHKNTWWTTKKINAVVKNCQGCAVHFFKIHWCICKVILYNFHEAFSDNC